MHRRKTIVVLGSYAESLINFRGAFLQALVEKEHHVVACAPAASSAVIDGLAAMGVAYRDVPLERAAIRPYDDLRLLNALYRLFRELGPDIVFSYTIKPVVYGLLAAQLAAVPHRFAMITGLGYTFLGAGFKGRLVGAAARQLYRLSLAGAERVIFQNPDDLALFRELRLVRRPGQMMMINGSGIDLEAFRPAPLPAGEVSFLLIARLLKEKGIREYVDAASELRAAGLPASFHLVGWLDEGNPASVQESDLRGWIADGIIQYHGRIDDVRPAIAAASVYVLPSYREGTPRTVLEAMAMGRPVVTTDAPGCKETVEDGVNGFLVPVREVGALAIAMRRFVEQPDLIPSMGRESRRIAEEKYDVHRVNDVILATMGLA